MATLSSKPSTVSRRRRRLQRFLYGLPQQGFHARRDRQIRVGQQYEPFGMETLISDSKYITFAERSFTDVFSRAEHRILAFMDPFENMDSSFALGVFKDDNGWDAQGDNEQAVTGRLTRPPSMRWNHSSFGVG